MLSVPLVASGLLHRAGADGRFWVQPVDFGCSQNDAVLGSAVRIQQSVICREISSAVEDVTLLYLQPDHSSPNTQWHCPTPLPKIWVWLVLAISTS